MTTVRGEGSLLDRVRVSAPCEADWNEMRGDERVRFCARCSLNVYNISAMTRRESERLVMASEGRLCVRFYRRRDGTTLTQNCPVGLRALKRRVSRISSAVAAAAISFFAGVGVSPQADQSGTAVGEAAYATADEADMAQGLWVGGRASYGAPVQGALLGGVIFLFGYPLLKIRQRKEAKERESLRIWRRG